ncbi:MAG: hypothetical protein ABI939_11095 [Anaerolineaceae bacterium]
MKPEPQRVLFAIAGALGTVTPDVGSAFGQQTMGLSAALSMVLAQEWDRAASRLVEENVAVTGLLERARIAIKGDILHARINELVDRIPATDLRVSALQLENDQLRRLLIEVHAEVDGATGVEEELLNRLIWDELRDSTRRRHLAAVR